MSLYLCMSEPFVTLVSVSPQNLLCMTCTPEIHEPALGQCHILVTCNCLGMAQECHGGGDSRLRQTQPPICELTCTQMRPQPSDVSMLCLRHAATTLPVPRWIISCGTSTPHQVVAYCRRLVSTILLCVCERFYVWDCVFLDVLLCTQP